MFYTKVLSAVACVLVAAPASVFATTWAEEDVVCPVCGATNTFQAIMSYGSYIYQWPSKFEYIFWPTTESQFLYSCGGCRFTCYMWDFAEIPADKKDALVAALKDTTFAGDYASYAEIPASERFPVAEKVYGVLGRDDRFWCDFYRIEAYQLNAEGKSAEAAAAREKALALAEKLLGWEENVGAAKELLLISGAMRHLLNDDAGALRDFEKAQTLTFRNKELDAEQEKNVDEYLTALLTEYVDKVKNPDEAED